jgi:hypothetical protein
LNDPSGHCGEGSAPSANVSQAQHAWLCSLHDKAKELSQNMSDGTISDVEALAQLMEFAAPHYIKTQHGGGRGPSVTYIREDKSGFIKDLGIVLGGIKTRTGYPPYELIDSNHSLGQYYVGYKAFEPKGSSGLRDEFTDGIQNQVRHFMGGMAGGSWLGGLGQSFQRGNEDDPLDQNLYDKAYELVDYLKTKSINTAGQWVRINLAKPQPVPGRPLKMEME